MKNYVGHRKSTGIEVRVIKGNTSYILSPSASLKLINHSPTGFEWGYGGPAQLALAVLLDYLGDPKKARALYQSFKWDFVARFDYEGFEIKGVQIDQWLMQQQHHVPEAHGCYEEAEA